MTYLTLMFPKKSQECVLARAGYQSDVGRYAPMTTAVPETRNAVIPGAVGVNAWPPTKVNIRG